MKEKTDNIDILEEMIKPIATRTFIFPDGRKEEKEIYNLERKQIEAIETLIAENKELKEEKEELKRENREIRNWKYTIDTYEDLDLLKRLDIIKIKGKEYIDKNLYDELKKDKKALINNYSKILGEFIPKDKIKAKIEIRKEEKENCKDSIEEKYLLREIYVLQSLLGKE